MSTNIDVNTMINLLPSSMKEKVVEKWENMCTIVNNGAIVPENTLIPNFPHVIRDRGHYLVAPGEKYTNGSDEDTINDTGYYLFMVRARQGGGNDECYCEHENNEHENMCLYANNETLRNHPHYVKDFYDSFDSTYITFVFENNIDEKMVDDYKNALKNSDDYENNLYTYNRVMNNDVPVWYILNPDEKLYEDLMLTYCHYTVRKKQVESIDKNDLDDTKSFLDNIVNHRTLDTDFIIPKKYVLGSTATYDRIKNNFDNFIDAQNILINVLSEINNLPYNDIKEFLFSDDRNTLIEKLNQSEYQFNHAFTRVKKMITRSNNNTKSIMDLVNDDYTIISEYEDTVRTMQSYSQKLWEQGWDFTHPLPYKPEKFFPFEYKL